MPDLAAICRSCKVEYIDQLEAKDLTIADLLAENQLLREQVEGQEQTYDPEAVTALLSLLREYIEFQEKHGRFKNITEAYRKLRAKGQA